MIGAYVMCGRVVIGSRCDFHICTNTLLLSSPFATTTSQDHPNIVRLEEVYESHSEIYLVQEVCKGGELFDRLDEQPDYHYTEAQVSFDILE